MSNAQRGHRETSLPYVETKTASQRARLWHWVLACTFLMMLLGNNIFRKPTLAALLLISVPFAVANSYFIGNVLRRSYSMLAFWIVMVGSIFWSVVYQKSLDLILTQSAFILLALLIACRHSEEGFSSAMRDAAFAFIALVIIYVMVYPSFSLTSQGLKAFFPHKNTLGAMLGLSFLVLMFAPGRKRWHIGVALPVFALLLLSASKTSISLVLICASTSVLAAWWARNMYPQSSHVLVVDVVRAFIFGSVIAGLVLLVVYQDEVVAFLWTHLPKTIFTGRGTLWLLVLQQLRGNSLLGIGPGAFWQAEGASEIARTTLYQLDPHWVQRMGSADGSYIDLIASFGMLGLALFLFTAVDLYRRLLRQWSYPDSPLIFVLVTFVMLHAVTESTLAYSTNILWLIYLISYFRLLTRPNSISA